MTATRRSHHYPCHVHLVGCNGVPSASYAPLLARLPVGSTSFTEVGHLADVNWHRSIDAVAADAARLRREKGPGTPVVAFGHSMGGALVYAAAVRAAHPEETFERVLLFDPPLFRPSIRLAMLALQRSRLFALHPLPRAARRRPPAFDSREEAEAFVRRRRLYQSFHPEVLAAFLGDGIVPVGQGSAVRFLFRPEDEVQYFMSTPTDLSRWALGETWMGQYDAARCPGECLYSTHFEFNAEANVRYLQDTLRWRRPPDLAGEGAGEGEEEVPFQFAGKDAGHFQPLVDPDDVASWITTFLAKHYAS